MQLPSGAGLFCSSVQGKPHGNGLIHVFLLHVGKGATSFFQPVMLEIEMTSAFARVVWPSWKTLLFLQRFRLPGKRIISDRRIQQSGFCEIFATDPPDGDCWRRRTTKAAGSIKLHKRAMARSPGMRFRKGGTLF